MASSDRHATVDGPMPTSPNGAVHTAARASIRAITGSEPYRCVSGAAMFIAKT